MQCGSCGNELPKGAARCPSCGTISSDEISHDGISPDDATVVSSPYGTTQQSPEPKNYGSAPSELPQNPYEQNPYGLTIPPPPPRSHRVKIGLVIGILALALILVGSISIFVWLTQSATRTTSSNVVGRLDTSFYYRLTNSYLGSGQALDVRSDGSYLLQMAQTGNYSGQFWKLVDLGAGKYALRTAYLGDSFSLDVINDGTNTTPQMKATGNYTGQSWSLVPWGDGTYKLTNDFTGPEKSLDTSSDTHEPFLDTGDHSGQYWTLTQLMKIAG